jgi:hypothetical protein
LKNKKTPGQIAVIITLFIAVIILFSIVVINIYKVGDVKLTTSQVSDRGALGLCSQLSTYVNLLQKKANSKGLIGSCTPNWELILPVFGILAGIALLPFTGGASTYLVTASLLLGMWEIGNVQAQGFSKAVYEMTEYTAYRESAVMTMLTSIQTDSAKVRKVGATTFQDDSGRIYDLVDTPGLSILLQEIKKNKPLYRFNAWYWGVRYRAVTETALNPIIRQFIEDVNQNIAIDKWNKDKFLIEELSLKLNEVPVTNTAPEWVYDSTSVKAVGPVKHIDKDDLTGNFLDMIWGLLGWNKGFLPVKFKELTERLIDAGYTITYSKKIIGIPLLGGGLYDHSEIGDVTDTLKGFLIRYDELLNLPVSYRISAINSWLPPLYNHNGDHTIDMYGKLQTAKEKIGAWITELEEVDEQLNTDIPPGAGDDSYGKGGDGGGSCATEVCCGSDCEIPCCSPVTCTYIGIYCTACGGGRPPVCSNGDLYKNIPGWCGSIVYRDPGCACGCGPQNSQCPDFCKFQGQLNDSNSGGPTEVRQAIVILTKLNNFIDDVCGKLEALDSQVETIINPTDPNIQQLKNEASYGWVDKNNGYHVVKVLIYGYPPRKAADPLGFPYLAEEKILGGLDKCWRVKGRTSGPITTKVYRYDSDVPAGWWNLRVRKNTANPEFTKGKLQAIINEIHSSAGGKVVSNKADLDDLTANYAISSATLGHYGPEKDRTYIEKAAP